MHGFNEETPLLLLDELVVPLRHSDVWKAARTWVEAFENDPQMRYLRSNRRQTAWMKFIDRIAMACIMTVFIRRKVALTVHSGAAIVIGSPGLGEPTPKTQIDRVLDTIVGGLASVVSRKFFSAEQSKRNKELEEKTQVAIKTALEKNGRKLSEMLSVMILATEPASQKRGYGGELLDAITSLADVTGQVSWLLSSNSQNTQFYRLHGFEIAGEAVVGDQNPTWHEAPVVVRIMAREPRRRR
ncbi:hypothetical protein GALMADRAFT_150974 [Galerina marginata CBS 339.88]|uniref:N-acetyltransferase domain-containing protein n=1 Tax=Galerina marginata (strain CBS 339.88) TaxID=685588 RepID=A0A067TLC9_GALM3|nr:hypothetical protein GALMADRAFT_150974 [Galerina marginata CBS 339.88]